MATNTTDVRIGFALTVIGALTALLVACTVLFDRNVAAVVTFLWFVVSVPLAVIAWRNWFVARTYGNSVLISDDVLRYGRPVRGFIRTDGDAPKGDVRVTAALLMTSDTGRSQARSIKWRVEAVVPESVREHDDKGRVVVPFSLILGDPPRVGRDPQIVVTVRSGFWLTSFAAKFELGRPLESKPYQVA